MNQLHPKIIKSKVKYEQFSGWSNHLCNFKCENPHGEGEQVVVTYPRGDFTAPTSGLETGEDSTKKGAMMK